jgi:hypothetical protein
MKVFYRIALAGVGVWTLIEKHPSLVLLTSGLYDLTAYILILAGKFKSGFIIPELKTLIISNPTLSSTHPNNYCLNYSYYLCLVKVSRIYYKWQPLPKHKLALRYLTDKCFLCIHIYIVFRKCKLWNQKKINWLCLLTSIYHL